MSIHLMPKRRMQKRQSRPKLNIKRLGDSTYQEQLQAALSTDLPKQCPYDAEKHWGRLSSTIMNCSKSILGHKKWKHQDWYDENDTEIQQLLDIKYQRILRFHKSSIWAQLPLPNPLHSKDELTLLKDKEATTNKWEEHYDTTPEMEALDKFSQQPIIENTGEPPNLEEVQDAIKKMKNNKAASPDGIPSEVPKEGGPNLLKDIHALLLKIWERITTISIMELQYEDNKALVGLSEEELQCTLVGFLKADKQLGLAINIKKTQILHQSPPNSIPVLSQTSPLTTRGWKMGITYNNWAASYHHRPTLTMKYATTSTVPVVLYPRKRVFDDQNPGLQSCNATYSAVCIRGLDHIQ
ncbi:hypothetical protein D5F01_LYC00023 [Larimichthys crocea]|uniref:Reverse transcriptase domain-containing protein n=1 Tax=Larimichthys crocea TaxID=215358 RepID=A0A6G0J857_LARCR|nr:hypothetical protein D5F01_LYC00023 [Larimichthys crocea]